ncbi:Conserved_hypothetical protein [Hexamita inflata]|uniref:Transmembrane protein n=1 Tax=Hexamita inflata TaxID=28002 RepID=A0AA86QK84_9EUKA|nr:Conserved hypothetical protein [Hexamita inflata]
MYKLAYKMNNRKYRSRQCFIHVIILTLTIISVASISIIYALTGIRTEYTCLHETSACKKDCKAALANSWLPHVAIFPTNVFKGVDLVEFQLQKRPTFHYQLCQQIKIIGAERFDFSAENGVLSTSLYHVQIPKTVFGESNQFITIQFDSQQTIWFNKEQILTNAENAVKIKVESNLGGTLSIQNMKSVQYMEYPQYQFDECINYQSNLVQKYQYIVASQKGSAGWDTLEFAFIGQTKVATNADVIFISLLIISGIGLIEAIWYFAIICQMNKKQYTQLIEWKQFVDNQL